MAEKNLITLPDNTKADDSQFETKQSANSLFRFVTKLDYLIDILRNKAFIPRYYGEDIKPYKIDINEDYLYYPMICFCDIPFHRINEHIHLYGADGYGIAFSKKWGIENKVQPLQYINPNSNLCSDFRDAFSASLKSETEDSARNFLLSQLFYYKPILGEMERDGNLITRVFTDECEWRYIAEVDPNILPQVIPESKSHLKEFYNEALKEKSEYWLTYDWDDIKYIIIKSRDELSKVHQLLDDKIEDKMQLINLISKIIVWDDMKGDF